MMTIEEAIKHCEEVAHQNEILMKRYDDASGYNRSRNEKIRTNGAKDCEQLISLYRQIAEWLKELKKYTEKDTPKLVIYNGDGYANGEMVYDWADCPSCGFAIEEGDADWEMSYCPSCGQALKWESEE